MALNDYDDFRAYIPKWYTEKLKTQYQEKNGKKKEI